MMLSMRVQHRKRFINMKMCLYELHPSKPRRASGSPSPKVQNTPTLGPRRSDHSQLAPSFLPTVVKMRIKEIKIENGDRKLIGAQKKKKLLKPGPLKRKDTKRLVLHMKNGAGCPCPQLDGLAGSFLVMGRKVDGQLLLMAVYRWDKKNKEMKFAVKFMFSYPCSLYYPFFYGAAEPH